MSNVLECFFCGRVPPPMTFAGIPAGCSLSWTCECGAEFSYAKGHRTINLAEKQLEVLKKYEWEWRTDPENHVVLSDEPVAATSEPEDYPGQNDEYRRQQIVENAVSAADEIIMGGSDGSVEETDYLTSRTAKAFVDKAHYAVQSKLLRYELAKRHKKGEP